MEAAQNFECVAEFLQLRGQPFFKLPKRMQAAASLPKPEQQSIGKAEQWSAQSSIDAQLVVRPLDCSQCIANRFDFLPLVERTAAHQHVRNMTRFERAHVRTSDVAAVRIK